MRDLFCTGEKSLDLKRLGRHFRSAISLEEIQRATRNFAEKIDLFATVNDKFETLQNPDFNVD